MKYILYISFFLSSIICLGQDSLNYGQNHLPKVLLKEFKKDPQKFRVTNFHGIWPKNRLVDSFCSLEIYEKLLFGFKLKYSTIIRNGKHIGFSFECDPEDYKDTSNYFESIYLSDTMNSLIGKNYQHFVKPGDSLLLKYKYILSPFSGLELGYYGNYASSYRHRVNIIFDYYIDSIPASEFYFLLCAANPYIRVLAAEHYFRNKKKYKKHKPHLSPILEQLSTEENTLFKHHGGCINLTTKFTAKSMFERYRRKKLYYRYVSAYPFVLL